MNTEDEDGFTTVKTKKQIRRERGSFVAVPGPQPVRQSAQVVRKQYSFALKTTTIDKRLLSPAAFSKFLKDQLGDTQPDHAQSIGAGTGWILSFSDHAKMSTCLELSKSWQDVTLDIAINKEDQTYPLVVARVGPHVLEEDFLSVEHVVRAGPIKKRNGEYTNKWKVSFSSRETRDRCLTNGFNIGFFHFETESYIMAPRVLQCFKCQKYGHTQKFCDAPNDTCFKCAMPHRSKECGVSDPNDFRCAVCKGRHLAISPDCPERVRAREAIVDRPYQETLVLRHQGVTTPPRHDVDPPLPPSQRQALPVLKTRPIITSVPDLHNRSRGAPSAHTSTKGISTKSSCATQQPTKNIPRTSAPQLPPTSTWGSRTSGDTFVMISDIVTTISNWFNSPDRSSPERIMSLIFSLWPMAKRVFDLLTRVSSNNDISLHLDNGH